MSVTLIVALLLSSAPCEREVSEYCGTRSKKDSPSDTATWMACRRDHIPQFTSRCRSEVEKEQAKATDTAIVELKKIEGGLDAAFKEGQKKDEDEAKRIQAKIDSPEFKQRSSNRFEVQNGLKQLQTAMKSGLEEKDVYPEDVAKAGGAVHTEHFVFGFAKEMREQRLVLPSGTAVDLVAVSKKYCPDCGVKKDGFKAIAIGNVDEDEGLEIWVIDTKGKPVQLLSDE